MKILMFKNKEGRLRPIWKIFFVLVAILVFSYIVSLFILLLHFLISGLYETKSDSLYSLTYFVLYILQCVTSMISVYIIWNAFDHKPISELGYTSFPKSKKKFLFGFVLGVVLATTICFLIIRTLNIKILGIRFNISLLYWFIVFLFVGISEELLFRGYIITVLNQMGIRKLSLYISSLIFAMFHLLNPGINILGAINIFIAGVLLGYMFQKSGDLWMSIGFHISWNYVLGCIFNFNVSGLETNSMLIIEKVNKSILSGGSFGPEGSLYATIILLIAITYVSIMTTKKDIN